MDQSLLERVSRDPHRPIYHFVPPANWMNDPNGPIQVDGVYHMFYQYNPFGANHANMHWGHARSRDLVHWEHLPIALAPTPDGPDKDGIYSGCCVMNQGTPTIIYTGVHPQVQCIATSDDGLLTWRKHPANPVIATPPEGIAVTGFRDPFAWREEDGWYMVVGSGIENVGGAALLYRSPDLMSWEYLGPLCTGKLAESGHMWECPNFFPLGEAHLLAVSPYGKVIYFLGDYADHAFEPSTSGLLDLGESWYAPNSLLDERGRRLMWGWLKEMRPREVQPEHGWAGAHSLPRELYMHDDGALGIKPAQELETLRGAYTRYDALAIKPSGQGLLGDLRGDALELVATFDPGTAESLGLLVRQSRDGTEWTAISYAPRTGRLAVDGSHASLDPQATNKEVGGEFWLNPDDLLTLHIYLDRSVIEVFANERAAIAHRVYPTRADSQGVDLFATGGTARLISLHAWEMSSIW